MKISTLKDAFPVEVDEGVWEVYTEEGGDVAWANRKATITAVVEATFGYGEIGSVKTFDLTESEIHAEVTAFQADTSGTADLLVFHAGGSYVRFRLNAAGNLLGQLNDVPANELAQTIFTVAYDAAAHRWLRIRETEGTVYFESSRDGRTWSTLGSVAPTTSTATIFSSVRVFFASSAQTTIGRTTTLTIDNVNIPPRVLPDRGEASYIGAGYAATSGVAQTQTEIDELTVLYRALATQLVAYVVNTEALDQALTDLENSAKQAFDGLRRPAA